MTHDGYNCSLSQYKGSWLQVPMHVATRLNTLQGCQPKILKPKLKT